jgi:K+-transporting ATPase ATPase C chain
MRRQLLPALISMIVFTIVLGIGYPLVVTGIAQAGFADRANGSQVEVAGRAVGSSRLGQTFTEAKYFHGRPSAAGAAASGSAATDPAHPGTTVPNDPRDLSQDVSSGSNLGPTNPELLAAVRRRVRDYRIENRLSPKTRVPVDAVTASGSGLDPDISVANARLQAPRVARVRRLPLARVMRLIGEHTDGRFLGFLGERGVNVLELNIALDRLA